MATRGIQVSVSELTRASGMSEAGARRHVELIARAQEPVTKSYRVIEAGMAHDVAVTRQGIGPLNTPHGMYWLMNFKVDDCWVTYEALVKADLNLVTLQPAFDIGKPILMRTDSGCSTGQRFHDQTCDCREQLDVAMRRINAAGQGIIVHIPHQDGRGKGMPFKLATLWLQQDLRIDTVQAASLLERSGDIDVRSYRGVIGVLKFLGLRGGNQKYRSASLYLLSNNPDKRQVFLENKFRLAGTFPLQARPTELTRQHLLAKKRHLGHTCLVD